ncbi:class I SAM-dependent methyltransferase [Patescibacteria group bacterium]|nr:class I SAM-dependent methyltransferase [Patescibacteria group bacterium]
MPFFLPSQIKVMTQLFFSSYLHHQLRVVAPLLSGCRSVLDFGCGDMALDRLLVSKNTPLRITGVDVLPFRVPKTKGLHFHLYDGARLPFCDRSFDAVFSYHVFHHTRDPFFALSECARVCKHRMIIVEPVLRYSFEKIGFTFLDYLTNIWKKEHVFMPCHVRTLSWWRRKFQTLNLYCQEMRSVGVLPRFFPIGETKLFVLRKRV